MRSDLRPSAEGKTERQQVCVLRRQTKGGLRRVSKVKKKAFGLEGKVYFAALDWERLSTLALDAPKSLKDLPKFPGTRRDIALLVDRSTSFSELQQLIRCMPKSPIQSVGLFDVYEGKGLPEGKILCPESLAAK